MKALLRSETNGIALSRDNHIEPSLHEHFLSLSLRRKFKKRMKHGRGMTDTGSGTPHNLALAMLDAFASVGATRFDVTWTNAGGKPRRYDAAVSLTDLTRTLPAMLDRAAGQQ